MMTLKEFRKTKHQPKDYAADYCYAGCWMIWEFEGEFSTGPDIYPTLEEAEEALYQMYCDEDSLLEGY